MKRTDGSILPMSTILPPAARDALVAASKIESRVDAAESPERTLAVDLTTASIRTVHPEYFR